MAKEEASLTPLPHKEDSQENTWIKSDILKIQVRNMKDIDNRKEERSGECFVFKPVDEHSLNFKGLMSCELTWCLE